MSSSERFEPHAARAMASMFDDVSGRYDLLNRMMTLGRDVAWREAMWDRVPEGAAVVLDLCTGSGVSLPGLRRPGRLVLGIDVSLAMLEEARDSYSGPGWAPKVACADAFRLPLRDASVDAITVAFGVRNLRPRPAALAEIARVLRPDGALVVLEATAPAPGPLHGPHAFWVRHVIPLAGRLSPDPTAYRYLSESIFEFGAGPEFERDMEGAGLAVVDRKAFMLGATWLWVARRRGGVGQNPADEARIVHDASGESGRAPQHATSEASRRVGVDPWRAAQVVVSLALTAALAWALAAWIKLNGRLPLNPIERAATWFLIVTGVLVAGVRAALQLLALGAPARRR